MSLGNGNPKEGDKGSNFNYELKVLQGLEAIAISLENQSKYKVYTALLTQSGGDNLLSQTSGTFTAGVSYRISGYVAGDDFSNIGGPGVGAEGQWDGEWFVATGTTPLNYTNGTLIYYNTGAPVVTVLENTIGNIWFTYGSPGAYLVNSSSLFTNNKSSMLVGNVTWDGGSGTILSGLDGDSFGIIITVNTTTGIADNNGALLNTLIEIRVYN